ncbi:hypothetical protein O5478_17940 [Escherichia coli]|nr:hypothetical protein [Escherichia coli]
MTTTGGAVWCAAAGIVPGGDGSELRQPLGITIVGGLVMSQLPLRCIPRRWCISFSTVCGCVFRVEA